MDTFAERLLRRTTNLDLATAFDILAVLFPWPQFHTILSQTESGKWRCDIEARGGDGPVYSYSAALPVDALRQAMIAAGG